MKLPLVATSFINVIEQLINDENQKIQSYKIIAITNKGRQNQQKFKIHIKKLQENFENIIFLRIYQIDLQEQINMMMYKELIFNSLNHDVKNPLIAGCLLIQNMIIQSQNGDKIHHNDLLDLLQYQNISLSLINGYFDFTQAQLGNLIIQIEKFLLYEPITNTIKMMQNSANKKLVRVLSKFDVRKTNCKNDVRRISQVLMNLINNAIKFSKKRGEVIVDVEEFICHNLIYVTVTDQGVGMSPEILNRIGLPYATFNIDNMNSQGTGIGLYTSIKTVGIIGPLEKIFISSVEGEGSQFSFFMYLNANHDQIKQKMENFETDIRKILLYLRKHEIIVEKTENEVCIAEEQFFQIKANNSHVYYQTLTIQNESVNKINKITIMVVDDEEIIRIATINAIKNLGEQKYQFLQAENGQVGVDLFKQTNKDQNDFTIDIIFTDIQMPELNGYGMIQQINQLIQQKNYQKPLIIALSSDNSKEYDENCKAHNIDQKLTKPISAEKIRQIIKQFEKIKESGRRKMRLLS